MSDSRQSFAKFLADEKSPATQAFFAKAKEQAQASLDRYINGLDGESKMMAAIEVPDAKELQKDYANIWLHSQCEPCEACKVASSPKAGGCKSCAEMKVDAQRAKLDAESECKISYLLDRVLTIACFDMLDPQGNLKSEVRAAFEKHDLFKHADVDGKAKDSREVEHKDDKEKFIRDKLVSGWAAGIIKKLSVSLKTNDQGNVGQVRTHLVSRAISITQARLDAAVRTHVSHFKALDDLHKQDADMYQRLVSSEQFKQRKTFSEFIKFASIGLIYDAKRPIFATITKDSWFLGAVSIEKYYSHVLMEELVKVNVKLQKKLEANKESWSKVKPYLQVLTSYFSQERLEKLRESALAEKQGIQDIILKTLTAVKKLAKGVVKISDELEVLRVIVANVLPRLYSPQYVLKLYFGRVQAQASAPAAPAKRVGLFEGSILKACTASSTAKTEQKADGVQPAAPVKPSKAS